MRALKNVNLQEKNLKISIFVHCRLIYRHANAIRNCLMRLKTGLGLLCFDNLLTQCEPCRLRANLHREHKVHFVVYIDANN